MMINQNKVWITWWRWTCTWTWTLLATSTSTGTRTSLVWEQRSSLPSVVNGRHHPITFANETHGFFMTGSSSGGSENLVTNDLYIYEELTDTWITTNDIILGGNKRSFGYGIVLPTVYDKKAYYGFGINEDGIQLNDLWEFDMVTLQSIQLTSCPCLGRRHPAMVPVLNTNNDGTSSWEIHIGLGDGQFGNYNDWWSYDINLNIWKQLDNFPGSKRHHPFYFSIYNKAYAGLGHSSGFNPYIERDWYMYDTTTSSWIKQNDFISYNNDSFSTQQSSTSSSSVLVSTEARVAGTQFTINDKGFILSGDGDDHSYMETGEFHMYDSIQDRWTALPSHPGISRWAPGSFVIRNTTRVYFTAGYNRLTNTYENDLYMIDLISLFENDNNKTDNSATTFTSSETGVVDGDEIMNQTIMTTTESFNNDYSGGSNSAKYSLACLKMFLAFYCFLIIF